MSLQELLDLTKKFGQTVVVSESGDVKAILLSPEKYIDFAKDKKVERAPLNNNQSANYDSALGQKQGMPVPTDLEPEEDVIAEHEQQDLPVGLDFDISDNDFNKGLFKSVGLNNDENLETFNVNDSSEIEENIVDRASSAEPPKPLSSLLTKRAESLFMDKPFGRVNTPEFDMRSEVVDPNFGKPANVDDDEEIQTSFENI